MQKATAIVVAALLIVVGGTAIGQYKEAPWHAEQVARGELPPVEERLPNEPFVYVNGGDMRMVEVGRYTDAWTTSDSPDQANIQGPTDYTLPLTRENNPYGLLDLESSDDFTVWTFYFREGMKFSDGSPFTVHDVLFWWNDLQLNDLYMEAIGAAAPHQGIMPGSVVEAIDDYTMRVTLQEPSPNYHLILTGDRAERHFLAQSKAYLSQFHPDYTDAATLAARVAESPFENWQKLLDWARDGTINANPDAPQLAPFVVHTPPPADPTEYIANPYWWAVDEANQQLPYIRGNRVFLVADAEARKLRALQGQSWVATVPLDSLELAKRAHDEGKVRMELVARPGAAYSSNLTFFNMDTQDEFKRNLFRDKRFRQAWSYFVPRQKLNDILYAGQAPLKVQGIIKPDHPWFVPEALSTPLLNNDLDAANQLLDEIGLTNKDSDGFRLGPDGKPITFLITTEPHAGEWEIAGQLLAEELPNIGLMGNHRVVGWEQSGDFAATNEWEIWQQQSADAWDNQVPDRLSSASPSSNFGRPWAKGWQAWLRTDGAEGEEPPQRIKDNHEVWKQIQAAATAEELAEAYKEWQRRAIEDVWSVGWTAFAPRIFLVNPKLGNFNAKWNVAPKPAVFLKE